MRRKTRLHFDSLRPFWSCADCTWTGTSRRQAEAHERMKCGQRPSSLPPIGDRRFP